MSDDLRELGKQLPWHRPDDQRREAVRSSLLVAAAEGAHPHAGRRWLLVGGGFAAGALAAAAIAIVIVRPRTETVEAPRVAYAQIEASSAAELEHTRTPSATGTDELVRVRTGKVRLAVPAVRAGDHVRVETGDAEIVGSGAYEIVVAHDALTSVSVTAGTASIKVKGQEHEVFLATGQVWHAPVITADLDVAPAAPVTSVDPAARDASQPPSISTTPQAASALAAPGTTTVSPQPGSAASTGSRAATDSAVPPAASSATRDSSTPRAPAATRSAIPSTPTAGSAPRGSSTARASTGSTLVTGGAAPGTAAVGSPRTASIASSTSGSPDASDRGRAPAATSRAPHSPVTDGAISAGEPERAPHAAVTAPSDPAPVPAPGAPSVAAPKGQPSATEQHFRAGWARLRANQPAEAAVELGAAADAGDSPLAADARYFQAVALERAKQPAAAEKALIGFLDRAPTSVRRGRAAVMLGRLIAERGDRASARAWFEAATHDPDPAVVAAARAGLQAP